MDSDLFESIFNLVKDLRATVMEAGATYYPRNNADAFPSVPYLLRFLDSVMPWLATQASAFVQATTAEGNRIHDECHSICKEPPLKDLEHQLKTDNLNNKCTATAISEDQDPLLRSTS